MATKRPPSGEEIGLRRFDESEYVPYICTAMVGKTTRIEARLSPDEREQIDRAAALAGESVSAFLVSAAIDRAEAVFEAAAVTVVPRDYFDDLLATIDEPDSALALRRAVAKAQESNRIDGS